MLYHTCCRCKAPLKSGEMFQLTLDGKYQHVKECEESLFDVFSEDLKKMRFLTWDIQDGFFWHVADIDEFSPEEELSFVDMTKNAATIEINLKATT